MDKKPPQMGGKAGMKSGMKMGKKSSGLGAMAKMKGPKK